MDQREIAEIIENALKDVADISGIKLSKINEETPIYGPKGCMDSLGLVSLIASIEDKLSKKNINVTIVSEKAFSRKISPFLTTGTLQNFIKELINEQ